MSMSFPLVLVRLFAFVGLFSILSACGLGESDSDDQTSQVPVPTQATPSESFENGTVVSGTDSNGIAIEILVESAFASDVEISEGYDAGLPETFAAITNGFIEITLPSGAPVRQLVKVISPTEFDVVISLDEVNSEMSYVPFRSSDDGAIEFYIAARDGTITFALMDVEEY